MTTYRNCTFEILVVPCEQLAEARKVRTYPDGIIVAPSNFR